MQEKSACKAFEFSGIFRNYVAIVSADSLKGQIQRVVLDLSCSYYYPFSYS